MKLSNLAGIKSVFFDNTTVKQTIFKNTFWLTLGMGAGRFFNFILAIYVTRILGATEYGKFSFALAFVSLFLVFADLGLSTIVVREFAKNTSRDKEIYSLFSLKIFLGFGMMVLIFISSFFITSDPLIQKMILILGFYALFNSLIGMAGAFFQARQRMEYQGLAEFSGALILLIIGLFVIFKFPSAQNLSFAYLGAVILNFILILVFFHFKISPLKISFEKAVWKNFLLMSWPLAFTAMLSTIYNNTDSVMLGYFHQITENGWYNAAYGLAWVFYILASLFLASFLPVLSRAFQDSKEQLQKVWNSQLDLTIILVFPFTLGGIFLAPKIITFLYGLNFLNSVLAFQILMVMAGVLLLYAGFSSALIVTNNQRKIFWVVLGGALANIILNLILIPKYSLYGAAAATVATHVLIFVFYFFFTLKFTTIKIPYLRIINLFIGVFASCLIMLFAISRSGIYNLNIIFSALTGAAIYLASIYFYMKLIKRNFSFRG
jgi:O-antigen/teichoic acid export membrane protein